MTYSSELRRLVAATRGALPLSSPEELPEKPSPAPPDSALEEKLKWKTASLSILSPGPERDRVDAECAQLRRLLERLSTPEPDAASPTVKFTTHPADTPESDRL